jgi:hypothetical protein
MLAKDAPAEILGRKASTMTPTSPCPGSTRAARTSRSPLSMVLFSCSANGGGTFSPSLKDFSRKERKSASSSEATGRTSIRKSRVNVGRSSRRRIRARPPRRRLPPRHRGRGKRKSLRTQNTRDLYLVPTGYHARLRTPIVAWLHLYSILAFVKNLSSTRLSFRSVSGNGESATTSTRLKQEIFSSRRGQAES